MKFLGVIQKLSITRKPSTPTMSHYGTQIVAVAFDGFQIQAVLNGMFKETAPLAATL